MDLSQHELSFLSEKLGVAWLSFPPTRPGISPLDVGRYALESPSYTFAPKVEEWPGASHIHFQRLWRVLIRISKYSIFGSRLELLINGRNDQGYTTYHGLTTFTSRGHSSLHSIMDDTALSSLIPDEFDTGDSESTGEDTLVEETFFADRRIYRTIEGVLLEESIDSVG